MSRLTSLKPVSSLAPLQELAHGLGELLNYDGNVEEDFYLTFQVSGHSYSRGRSFMMHEHQILAAAKEIVSLLDTFLNVFSAQKKCFC